MAYYSCMNFQDGNGYTVKIIVHGISAGQRLRFFLRKSSTSVLLHDDVLEASSSDFEISYYNLEPNTSYTVNVGLVSSGDLVYQYLGDQTFTTGGGSGPGPSRPLNWSWWSVIQTGFPIAISANEWNAFCERINAFRSYKGLPLFNFTIAYSGLSIYAYMVNQARDAIYGMNYYVPSQVNPGEAISASIFIGLQNALNNIQ